MSAAASSSSKAPETKEGQPSKGEHTVPHLGMLEEDDEFEEFTVAGAQVI